MSDRIPRRFQQPTAEDVHVDVPLGTGKPKRKTPFDSKGYHRASFVDRLVAWFKGNPGLSLTEAQFATLRRSAVGETGGKAKALRAHEWRFAESATTDLVMVGLFLDSLAAQSLAVPGGEAPDDLHVTLAIPGAVADFDDLALARMLLAVQRVAATTPPLSGEVGGWGRFYGDDADESPDDPDEGEDPTNDRGPIDVFYASPDVPELDDLEEAIEDALESCGCGYDGDDADHGFVPHITLAYVPRDQPNPATDVPRVPLAFSALTFCVGGKRTAIPFGGMADTGMAGYPMPAMYGDVVVAPGEHGACLFAEVELAEVPSVVPILPKPGDYTYRGQRFSVTPALIDAVVRNFDGRVRPQDVAINMQHVSKTAGAAGYVRRLVRRADGGLDGIPEFTDLGRQLIERDRFKYCSAELDDYVDPLTLDVTPDVLVGLALTTDPYFKETYLPRLAASEDAADGDPARQFATEGDLPDSCFAYVPDGAKGADGSKSLRKLRLCDMSGNLDAGIVGAAAAALGPGYRGQKVDLPASAVGAAKAKVRAAWHKVNPDKKDDAMPAGIKATEEPMADDAKVQLTDEQMAAIKAEVAKEFGEKLAAAETREQEKADEAKAFAERVATLEDERRTDRLMAEIRGKSDANGTPYLGDRAKVFAHMATLAKQFGEDSEEFRFYRDEKRAEAARAVKSGLFAEIGSDAPGDGATALDRLNAAAKARQKDNPAMTFAEAFTAECEADRDLFAEYQRERS